MSDHTMALNADKAINVMHDMCLITKETFDRFLIGILAWYKDEAVSSIHPPNLYQLIEHHEVYTQIFYDLFVESLAWRHYTGVDASKHFDKEDKLHFSQLFRDNIGTLYELMIHDYERLLRSIDLVYIWDSRHHNGQEFWVKNYAVCEVW